MHFCNRRMNALNDPALSALIIELSDMRRGRFADDMTASPLLAFLTAFFLPDDRSRFLPIGQDELNGDYPTLTKRLSDFPGIPIPSLLEELALAGRTRGWENHKDQKLYVALNKLLQPICTLLKRPKERPLDPMKRLEIRRRRIRDL